ncbi:MAG: DUF2804 family protein [Acidimicrobiales bacterium]
MWWADLASGATGGAGLTTPLARGYAARSAGHGAAARAGRRLRLSITDDAAGTHLSATWVEADGRHGRLVATVLDPPGHESLNVVIPWSDRVFQYTSKHQARPAHGVLEVGDDVVRFGGDAGEAWGCSTSGGAGGRTAPPGTGVVAPGAPATAPDRSSASSSAPSGPRGRAPPRTACSSTAG